MIKILILLLLFAACNCTGTAPHAVQQSRQDTQDWQRQRDQQASQQWQTIQIQNQQQIDRQNREWKPR